MKIGIFSDSISVPPKEGISLHVYELLQFIANDDTHDVVLFMCDRGMTNTDALLKERFTTVLIPEQDFFNISRTAELIARYDLDIAQTHKTYIAATVLGEACKRASIPMVYEVHDLEMNVVPLYFPGQDGQSEVMKHDAYQHQAASYASLVRVMSKFDFDIMSETWEDYDSNTFVWLPVAAAAAESDFTLDK